MAKSQSSIQTQEQAMKVARATQRPGQTKEQTKLIAQGIEKGIAEYKKQQKQKNRVRDKKKKQIQKLALEQQNNHTEESISTGSTLPTLPWWLLAGSWLMFVVYVIWSLK